MQEREQVELFSCLSGKEIFTQKKWEHYLTEIKNVVSCPPPLFMALYVETLYRVAELCQALPVSEAQTESFSLLKRQLDLAVGALKLRRGMFLPKGALAERIALEAPQWTFAVFSAALLKGLYYFQYDRDIYLYHPDRTPAGKWHLLCGSLYEAGRYYEVKFVPVDRKKSLDNALIMAALLGRTVPALAMRWISENEKLFSEWSNILFSGTDADNELSALILLAESKLHLSEFSKINKTIVQQQPVHQKFIGWIMDNQKKLSADVLRFEEGVFVSEPAIDQYLSQLDIACSKTVLLETLQKEQTIIESENGFIHVFSSKNFADRKTINGVLLHGHYFGEELVAFPINKQYVKHFTL